MDGLSFYKRLALESGEYLYKGGILIMEIGFDQYKDVRKLLIDNNFNNISVIKDYAGLDRIVVAYATEHDY